MFSSRPWPNIPPMTVDAEFVVNELGFAILALRGGQRPHAPDIRIAIDAIPCTVEKHREAPLLLLCTCKVWLIATFRRRTANDHSDRDDGDDAKK